MLLGRVGRLASALLRQMSVRIAPKPFWMFLREIGVRCVRAHPAHDTNTPRMGRSRALAKQVASIEVRAGWKVGKLCRIESYDVRNTEKGRLGLGGGQIVRPRFYVEIFWIAFVEIHLHDTLDALMPSVG